MTALQPTQRCKCGAAAVLEKVRCERYQVRCLGCAAVELSFEEPATAVWMWDEAQREHRAAAIAKAGEGAGDKLREDAP